MSSIKEITVTSEWVNDDINLYDGKCTNFSNHKGFNKFLIEVMSKEISSVSEITHTIIYLPKEMNVSCLNRLVIKNYIDFDGVSRLNVSERYVRDTFKQHFWDILHQNRFPITLDELAKFFEKN